MSTVNVHLAQSIHEQALAAAEQEGISIDLFIATAVAEKVATLQTFDYLKERARRGSRERLLEILAKAPDVEPEERDRL